MSSIYGLLGESLGHSLSPEIHSRVFRELNLNNTYHLFEVKKENLRDCIIGLKALGIRGVNVTIPYKVEVMKYLDEISREAREIDAVNTICLNGNKLIGYNTDYYGFGMLLNKNGIATVDKSALILGGGGAAKSVIRYLLDNNIGDITIAGRDTSKISEIFKGLRVIPFNEINLMGHQDMVINCTPCGMHPNINASPIKKEELSKFNAAVDLIYNPGETLFLKYADELGIKAVNGLYMLVGQAVKSEEIWNGININEGVTARIYNEIFNIIQGEKK